MFCSDRLPNRKTNSLLFYLLLFLVSYEDTELLFYWKKDNGNKEVMVSDELEIPQFILTKYWTASTFANFTSGGF